MGFVTDNRFGWLMHDHLDVIADVTNLKNTLYVIPIWNSISTNTGSVTVPKVGGGAVSSLLYSISPDRFPGAADCLITKINGVPTQESVYTAAGALVTSTLSLAGAYALSGTPASTPNAIIFLIEIQGQYLSLLDLDYSFPEEAYTIPSLLSLTDTPKAYAANQFLLNNAGATAMEFSGTGLTYTRASQLLTLSGTSSYTNFVTDNSDATAGSQWTLRNNNLSGWLLATWGSAVVGNYAFGLASANGSFLVNYSNTAHIAIGTKIAAPLAFGTTDVER